MVRTRANNAAVRKSVAAKAPRKNVSAPVRNIHSPSVARKGSLKRLGGNPVKIRPTPSWQKGIDLFLSKNSKDNNTDMAGCSSGCGSNGMSSKAVSMNTENEDILNKGVETIEIPEDSEEQRNDQGSDEEQEGSDQEQENQGYDDEQEGSEEQEECEEQDGSEEEQEGSEEQGSDEEPNEDTEDEQQQPYMNLLADDIAEVVSD